jgi:adenylate cyclase
MRALLLGLVAAGAAAVTLAAYATHVLRGADLSTVDTRFVVRGRRAAPRSIVIVAIDAATFQALNTEWPFPRAMHAQVIDRIAAQDPAAIAYDVQFSESSPGSPRASQADEVALLEAIDHAHGATVFATTETDAQGNTRFLGSTEGSTLLREVGSRAASGLFPDDSAGGVIRQMQYAIGGLPTLAVAAVEVATHRRVRPSTFAGGHDWIDFAGPGGTFRTVSFADVYRGDVPPGLFRHRIVVVGPTAPSLQDLHATPTDALMSGAELQANAIATVLNGMDLATVPGWVNIALIVILAAAVPLVSLRAGPRAATAAALGLGAAFAGAAQIAFDDGAIVSIVYPLGGLVLSTAGSLGTQLVSEAYERIRVRDLFTRFVPEDVVDEVLASADGVRLGGVQRDGTVMFCDLRGFTALAESLAPERVIEVLNRYLSEMSDAILDHSGTLVAYMGDGIMAVFGAPLSQADHADRALAAAREMLEVRLPRFNAWLREAGLGSDFRIGIGLNSGHVMSGHVGSERRVEYTAVGDTTNTAARIEAMTKDTPHQLLFSGSTRDALAAPPSDLRHVRAAEVRGRTATLELWTLGSAPGTTRPPLDAGAAAGHA